MSTATLEVRNIKVYGAGELVAIGIQGHQIVHVGPPQDVPTFIDGRGLEAFCTRIDPHVHDRSPGHPLKEDVDSIQRAAIAGGTTTIVAQPNTDPCLTTADRWLGKVRGIQKTEVNYYQWFGATPNNFSEAELVYQHPRFVGIKEAVAITTGTGDMLVDKKEDQRKWCRWAADHQVLRTCHLENQGRISRNEAYLRKQRLQLGLQDHCVIRDPQAEIEAVAQELDLSVPAGGRLNVCHVSCAESIALILAAQAKGLDVTFEVCPQYWRFTDQALGGEEGWRAKCNPPLRSEADRQALQDVLCNEGVTNALLATDHAPHRRQEDKRAHFPDPFRVASGMPGLDTATLLCWQLVHEGKMSRNRFADVSARNPAQLLGLSTKGEIAPGYDADIMLIDPRSCGAIRDQDMQTKCGWTPWHGVSVQGAIRLVMASGRVMLNRLT